jgi:hypothetical protein
MTKEPRPVSLNLTKEQAAFLLEPSGDGGHQQLHEMLRSQLIDGSLTISLDDYDLGKVIRYMTQYGSGGFQDRLRKALQDPLVRLLAGHGVFGPIV